MHRLTLPLLLAPLLTACQPSLEKLQGPTMGSTWHISYVRDGRAPKAEQVQAEVQQLLDAMDKAVSTYRNDSDVARFNTAPAGTCMAMPAVVTGTLAPYAQQLHRQSEGAFDITLLPALDAWGFGPKAAAQKAKATLQPGAQLDEILKAPDAPGTHPHTVAEPPSDSGADADPDAGSGSGSGSGSAAGSGSKQDADKDSASDGRPTALPVQAALAALRQHIGQQHLRIKGNQLCKDAPISIEFNSIAAGAVIDQIADRFQALGINNYLIEVTGELRAQGAKPDGSPWRIAIEAPLDGSNRQAQKILTLNGQSVSTSGDYRQYREENGQRLSHLIAPRSLRPITHRLASVTVIQPKAMQADGLSTLLMVLGPDTGYEWAVNNDIAALFVSRAESGFDTRSTPAFDRVFRGSWPSQ